MSGQSTKMDRDEILDGDSLYLPLQVVFRLSPPRSLACQHLKEDDTDCPDIAFEAVDVLIQCLQWHIDWRAHII